MSKRAAEWLLAAVIFARSTSLLFAKVGLESMSPLNLLAVRFGLAFMVLCAIFWKKLRTVTRTDLLHGMILGAVFFAVMTCETFALTKTTASNVSFLVNTAIVIVPLFEAALHRKAPDHRTLLCAAVTLAGVGFLTLKDGFAGFGPGEALCLLEACLYAGGIILTGRFSLKGDTIPHEVIGVFGAGKVLLKPATEGTGIIAGGTVRDVVQLAGIKNIRAKCLRSNNPTNVVKATFEGLKSLRTAEDVAKMRGLNADALK